MKYVYCLHRSKSVDNYLMSKYCKFEFYCIIHIFCSVINYGVIDNPKFILFLFPKVRFSRVCMLIKNIIKVFNLIYFLLYCTLSNNFPPMKFNQFKYSPFMFLKSIKKYLNNIENLSLWNNKKI